MSASRLLGLAVGSALVFAVAGGAGTNEHRISSAEEFIEFSNDVGRGTSFEGTTVFLDADIDFAGGLSQQFKPIGIYTARYFNGTFDGQGHTISNLVMDLSSDPGRSIGLFGFSLGLTIMNVVVDGSCSFTSSFTTDSTTTSALGAGIIGQCYSRDGPCKIENCVNMADIIFTGSLEYCLCIGGIAGHVSPSIYEIIIKNCANYGSITNNGKNIWRYMGGIVGEIYVESIQKDTWIQNCVNYGTLSSTRTSNYTYVGGIIGALWNTTIENCVNTGKIAPESGSKIGNIAGIIFYSLTATITNCYWTNDTGCGSLLGGKSQESTIIESSSHPFELSEESLKTMNEYATEKGNTWNKWFLLHFNGGKIKNVNQKIAFVAQKSLPKPAKEGNTFLFWAKDSGCTEAYDLETDSVNTLYAGWDINTLTFDFGNGTTANETTKYNATITYPEDVERDGYTFGGWDKSINSMPARNITITARWILNNYTLTFIFNNGTKPEERIFNFSDKVVYPENVGKEGHKFIGWDKRIDSMPSYDLNITALWIPNNYTVTFDFGNGTTATETIRYNATITYPENVERDGYKFDGWDNKVEFMPARDFTVKALWSEITEYVEINIEKKDLTEDDVRELVHRYVGEANYEVRIVELNKETGETKVIIKFTDKKKTEEFVRRVESSGSGRGYIKTIRFVDSFSSQSESFSRATPVYSVLNFITI